MKNCLFFLLVLTSISSSAQTIDQVKKFKSQGNSDAPQASPSSPSQRPADPANSEAQEINEMLRKAQPPAQPTAQPTAETFNFLLNPKVQKLAKFLSNKKVVTALNTFSAAENITKMFKAQLALMLVMVILRAWMSPKTKTFLAGFIANLWLTGLYLFLSLLLLPNFIYGPSYLEFVKAAFAFSKEFTS